MRSRYNRGNGDSALLKLLIFVIAVPSVFAVVFGLFNSASTPAANPPPSAPTPAVADPPGLDACTAQQLVGQPAPIIEPHRQTADGASCAARLWCDISGSGCDVSWNTRTHYLCTDHGHPIAALEYVEGSLEMTSCTGQACFQKANPRFNCHGDSFGNDEYWIQDPDAQRIIDDDYTEVSTPQVADIVMYRACQNIESSIVPCTDDTVTSCRKDSETHAQYCARLWSSRSGSLVHSATWVGPPSLSMTFGKRGFEPYKRYMPVGPGPDAAWADPEACVKYFRRTDMLR